MAKGGTKGNVRPPSPTVTPRAIAPVRPDAADPPTATNTASLARALCLAPECAGPPAGRPSLAGRASSVDSGAGDDDDDDATPAAAGGGGGAPTAPTAAAGGGAPVVAGIDARGIAATIALGSTTRTAELLRKLSEGLDGDNDVMMPSSLPRS